MTKSLLLIGCGIALALPVLAEKPAPMPELPKTDAPPPTMDEGDLLRKILDLDMVQDTSHDADPNAQKNASSSKAGQQGPTVILAQDTDFQEKLHVAVFTRNVVVNNASFNLLCDKLTAYMAHKTPAEKAAAAAAKIAATPTPTPGGKKSMMPAGGDNDALERAVAEGSVQISQDKMDDSGNITHSVGHGKKAVYEKATGTITLTGMPDVQQGDNLCVATSESTVIYMFRDGRTRADGPHKITIKEGQQDPKKQAGQ